MAGLLAAGGRRLVSDDRRVYGVWRIAGLAGDLTITAWALQHRRRRFRDRRSRDGLRATSAEPGCKDNIKKEKEVKQLVLLSTGGPGSVDSCFLCIYE